MKIKLEKEEKILLQVHKHWFNFLGTFLLVLVLAVAPPLLLLILRNLDLPINFSLAGNAISLGLFMYSIWLLLLWIFLFIEWTDYYLDVWYITNKRIIDAEQKGIFHREVSSLYISRIQDVTIEIRGIIPTIFGFGDLHVQTAGEDRAIILKTAAKPEYVKELIMSQITSEDKMSV